MTIKVNLESAVNLVYGMAVQAGINAGLIAFLPIVVSAEEQVWTATVAVIVALAILWIEGTMLWPLVGMALQLLGGGLLDELGLVKLSLLEQVISAVMWATIVVVLVQFRKHLRKKRR